MAKAPPKPTGTSRIRFIMVEAELADGGDLSQVTQAIQNALRPPAPAGRLAGPAQPRNNGSGTSSQAAQLVVDAEEQPELADDESDTADPDEGSSPAASTPKAPRKFRSPEIIEFDLTTEPSFAQFAANRGPTSHHMRYLTVAAWFKEHRQLDAVTVDHVYTCYRAVKWPTDFEDFAKPLRQLKFRKFLSLKGKGEYAINHIGLQEVENLKKQ